VGATERDQWPVQGATSATVFKAYDVEEVLAPGLLKRRGQKIVVLDNVLGAHKGERVRGS
jgi:hypothetical protein